MKIYRNSRWLSITKCPRIPMCDAYSSNLAGNLFLDTFFKGIINYYEFLCNYSNHLQHRSAHNLLSLQFL